MKESGLEDSRIEKILEIVENISFRKELEKIKEVGKKQDSIEKLIVQDADRLDAIGAIGIARCFTFSGAKGLALYDQNSVANKEITFEEYNKQSASNGGNSLNHFYGIMKNVMIRKTF